MQLTAPRSLALVTLILLPTVGCHTSTAWHIDDGLAADSLEVQIDHEGHTREIEYIVTPDEVPEAIHDAMDALFPGGTATGAEKEYDGGELYWELTKNVDGYAVEAMFAEDGALHSAEAEVSMTSIPQAVRERVQTSGWGQVRAWEQIRDSANELVEYHVKTTRNGRNYKLALNLAPDVGQFGVEVQGQLVVAAVAG
ncbi:MAG: hypothetical protein AAFZ65_18025, partial [Planctomycetota bacterium]